MTQRGRHRRRRRGRALRGFLAGTALALTAAATMISASQATVSDAPGALKQVEVTTALRMTEDLVPQTSLDRLSAGMGRPVGVSAVLEAGDRLLRDSADCTAAERGQLPVAPEPVTSYCWDAADTLGWRPGALTTSGDADDDGVWGTNRVILSGWSRAGAAADGGFARVAFVDANDPDRLTYSWVLLAVPVSDGADFRALRSGLTGMVWYQDKLLVTADDGDGAALYVFDMNRIQRASVDGDAVGRVAGGWSAHRARFVLPAVGTYRLGAGSPRPDTISLDRSTVPDSLVAGESTRHGGSARLWRYALSSLPDRGGLLAADMYGRVAATEAYRTEVEGLRGVLSRDDAWYVSQAPGADHAHGTLWRQDTEGTSAAECDGSDQHACWSEAPQSLSYWAATGEVWSQSGRTLFAMPLASVDRAAKKQWSDDDGS
ncbi:hypothetical protein ABZX85_05650 [Streptomyces sp. NPDC004539]|uniref:hypothetical protein n=1 Tax=Streptomyces sp. NPDC004539 TaxID=3154280 RepID=UPI0033A83C14